MNTNTGRTSQLVEIALEQNVVLGLVGKKQADCWHLILLFTIPNVCTTAAFHCRSLPHYGINDLQPVGQTWMWQEQRRPDSEANKTSLIERKYTPVSSDETVSPCTRIAMRRLTDRQTG